MKIHYSSKFYDQVRDVIMGFRYKVENEIKLKQEPLLSVKLNL